MLRDAEISRLTSVTTHVILNIIVDLHQKSLHRQASEVPTEVCSSSVKIPDVVEVYEGPVFQLFSKL